MRNWEEIGNIFFNFLSQSRGLIGRFINLIGCNRKALAMFTGLAASMEELSGSLLDSLRLYALTDIVSTIGYALYRIWFTAVESEILYPGHPGRLFFKK